MAEIMNKYLVFSINNEQYAIPISKVREVIRYVTITPIHETISFIKGVINLRGKIIPIVDMRLKFGMPENPYNERTIFIIVDIHGAKSVFYIGISVDAVHDVVDVSESDMEKTPEIGLKLKSQYLLGIAKIKDRMVMLLNMDRVLTSEEIVSINEMKAEA